MSDAPSILRQAIALHKDGKLDEAERLYRSAIGESPEDTNALHFFGLLEIERGRAEEGLALFDSAIAAEPKNAAALYNRGNLLRDMKRFADALASYDAALALWPNEASILTNRGALLADLKRYDEALADYDRAFAISPRNPILLNNRGNALHALHRFEEAIASFDAAIAIDPRMSNAHFNRGVCLIAQDRHTEALKAFDTAVAIQPDFAEAHKRRGDELFSLHRAEEASAAYRRAYQLDPDLPYLEGTRLLTKMYVCDWTNIAAERDRLLLHVRNGRRAAQPFAFFNVAQSPADELVCAKTYAQAEYPAAAAPLWTGGSYSHEKIRLGYISGEFHEQPTSYLTVGLFESHARDAFELHAFSTGRDDKSAMRRRVVAAFDAFHDVSELQDRDIAEVIRAAEIDILVDLKGYFGTERTGVLAFRPAPVQVNYLGYPGTLGAPYMDYIVADRWIVPGEHKAFYSEAVVHLPGCYQANDNKRPFARTPRPRASLGLPDTGFVFACFNNAYKITPEMFDIWMRLLRETPGSVLWLLELDRTARRNLAAEAGKRGIPPARLVFAPQLPQAEHLARIGHADLFLDTLPVNAHTTASDALWCGLPIVTCPGNTFVGRVAASLLSATGLAELIAPSLAEYEALALSLARDPERLGMIKAKLADARTTSPLFDTPRFAKHIESAYRTMWERQLRGLPAESFTVPDA